MGMGQEKGKCGAFVVEESRGLRWGGFFGVPPPSGQDDEGFGRL
jgi:hypothetical protein